MKRFAGISDPYATLENAKIILQAIPYDGTSTWGKGADKGFDAFIEASENMELFDIETNYEVYKKGVFIPKPLEGFKTPEQMFQSTYRQTLKWLKSGKFLTFFGGEHSISIGIIKAFYEQFEKLTILHLDAHADLRPNYLGTPYNHACAVHDASLNTNLIQVGIRSMDVSEQKFMDKNKTYFAHTMYNNNDWMAASINQMTENVYITLDLDVLDPSIMPATGTPEPGGMNWYQINNYLQAVFEKKNVIGFDMVELAPIKGLNAPQYLAAKLYYKMLSYKFK